MHVSKFIIYSQQIRHVISDIENEGESESRVNPKPNFMDLMHTFLQLGSICEFG